MKKILFLLIFGWVSVLPAKELNLPEPLPLIERCYYLSYDARTKNPYWVYERITPDSIQGYEDRNECSFKEDPVIPKIFRATLSDYRNSGFDRGHLAPAANHRLSAKALEETFFLSNMSPQNPQFNRGYWSKFEKYVRDLTKEYQFVDVFTGPLYLPKEDEMGKKWVTYQVIGENEVAVPTHFFKLITLQNSKGVKETEAFILPNEEISSKTPLENFKTTVQRVEKASGILFSNKL